MPNWWELHDGDTDGDGVVDDHEMGMIMIKPDNFRHASSLPGHIIDLISTTGLHCRGCRVVRMSMAQATEFYGFLEPIFAKKLKGQVTNGPTCLAAIQTTHTNTHMAAMHS